MKKNACATRSARGGNQANRGITRLRPLIESLESKTLLSGNAIPQVALTVPPQSLIGTQVNFSVGFDNASLADPGYSPYIDLFLPKSGDDGPITPDGLSFTSASYLGQSVVSTVLTFDALGHATHPYAKDATNHALIISGTPGDQLVVLQLPFGSFTPGQPTALVDVSAALSNKADVGLAQTIQAEGGFALGNDPLANPAVDPSIVGASTTASVTGELYLIKKTYLGPEDETATGPNFPRQDLITLAIAPGQTITNLDLADALPINIQFVAVANTSILGTTTATLAQSTPSTSVPGGTITQRFTIVHGTGAANDVSMLITYYVPLNNSSAQPVIDPLSGAPAPSLDTANASGNWTPLNITDLPGVYPGGPASHLLTDRSLATQKTVTVVAPGATSPIPGDTLQYAIAFQVSDFFAFQQLLLTDVISDGQRFDPTFTPTLQVNGNPFILSTASMDPANYSVTGNYTGVTPTPVSPDGSSSIAFKISNEMITRGQNGQLLGGLVPPGGGALVSAPGHGPTTGVVIFRTVIQNAFTNTFPSGEPKINQGDVLTDKVTINGDVLADSTLTPTGGSVTDVSSQKVVIAVGALTKSIYAINGNTSFSLPPKIAAGDTVTYRLQYDLPLASEESLVLSDFLPLPIFDATSVSTFDNVQSASPPATSHAQLGPNDTFSALSGNPSLTSDSIANSLKFTYPNYKDPANGSAKVDILFTVTASNQPFADGLFLTNQGHVSEGTTNALPISQDAIVQIKLTEPLLRVTKGAIATNEPNAIFLNARGPVSFTAPGTSGTRFSSTITSTNLVPNPVHTNVKNIQAGDLVSFGIVVENTGSGLNGAFNVKISDLLPAGLTIPGGGSLLNLSVTDGSGAPIAYTDLGGSLFGSGIELVDSGGLGALSAYNATSGHNLVVITYDLQATTAVVPNQTCKNSAVLTSFAAAPGGPNFLPAPLVASAGAFVPNVAISKQLTSTDQSSTSGNNLAIGEVATYNVTLTFPEGTTPSAKLNDILPSGLALVSVDSITPSFNISSSKGAFSSILAAATIGSNGSSYQLDFGTLINSDATLGASDTIVVSYRAVALNVAANVNGASLMNNATFTYQGGSAATSATALVALPLLQISKTIDNPDAEAGDIVTYTVVVQHAPGSAADAFNLNVQDVVPTSLTYVANSLKFSLGGLAPSTFSYASGLISASYAAFPLASSSTFTFQATVVPTIVALQQVTNTATAAYTSLPAITNTPISPYNSNSYERTGNPADPGGAVNDLNTSASANFTPQLQFAKSIVSTDQTFTTGPQVAIGEQVRYHLVVTIPQGVTPNATLVDILPPGLAFVDIASVAWSPTLSADAPGGLSIALNGPQIGVNGGTVTFNLGSITNSDSDSTTHETIVVDYNAIVLNTAANQTAVTLTNSATFNTSSGSKTDSAPTLTIVVPKLLLTEQASSSIADVGGAPVTFTLVLSHDSTSTTDALDVHLNNLVPSGFTLVPASLQLASGVAPTTLSQSGNILQINYNSLPLGQSSTLTFQAILNNNTTPGQTIIDTSSATYTTLPGSFTTPLSIDNPLSTERTGSPLDPGSATNNLVVTASVPVTIAAFSLSGFVYVDANNNGLKEINELALSPITITLTGFDNLDNPVNLSTTTDSSGAYSFNDLHSGNYTLNEIPPGAPYVGGLDSLGTLGGTNPTHEQFLVSIPPAGENVNGSGYNFAEILQSSLSGTVYLDLNNDGVNEPDEPPIAGVTVTLTGLDAQEAVVNSSVTTAADGSYLFPGLRPGTYTITETQPVAYNNGRDTIGTPGGANLVNNQFSSIILSLGTAGANNNFGELGTTLSGSAFFDGNANAVLNPGEPGISGILITLLDVHGNLVTTTTTASDGSYAFSNLPAGSYTILETPPAGYGQSTPISLPVSLPISGLTGENFGLTLASLNGNVYVDANNDGVRNPSEPGLGGVTITLTGTDVNGHPTSQTTISSSDGSYVFNALLGGTYTLTETPPKSYLPGQTSPGTLGGSATTHVIGAISVSGGENGTIYNFGQIVNAPTQTTSSLSGTVYYDYNRNGRLDTNDFGIAHTPVILTGTDSGGNAIRVTTVTDASGRYSFSTLQPGLYTISDSPSTIFLPGKETVGTSGGAVGINEIVAIPLTKNSQGTSYNFGEYQKPGCNLADLAFHIGRSFARDTQLRNVNPSLYDSRHPLLGSFLSRDVVPIGVGSYPTAPLSYYWVPTLGAKVVPYEPWVGRVKVVHHHLSAASALTAGSHPRGPVHPYRTAHSTYR